MNADSTITIDLSTVVALGLAFLLAVIHFLGERLHIPEGRFRWRLISLGAGISIGYLFLHLLPETYLEATYLKEWVFVALVLGFALVHLAEKFAYKNAERTKLVRELKVIHLIIFFLYYFLVGVTLEDKARIGILEACLFIIPVMTHSALSTSSLAQMHGRVKESLILKILMSSSVILGVVLALVVNIPPLVDSFLTSFIAGILIYVFVKEFLPERRKGEPGFFIVGLVVFLVFYVLVELYLKK